MAPFHGALKIEVRNLPRKVSYFALLLFLVSCNEKKTQTVTTVTEQQLIKNTTTSEVTLSYRKLCGTCTNGSFKRVTIKAGETQRVTFDSVEEKTYGSKDPIKKPVELEFYGDLKELWICKDNSMKQLEIQAVGNSDISPAYSITAANGCELSSKVAPFTAAP